MKSGVKAGEVDLEIHVQGEKNLAKPIQVPRNEINIAKITAEKESITALS